MSSAYLFNPVGAPNYTFPASAGTAGQVLTPSGTPTLNRNQLVWTTPAAPGGPTLIGARTVVFLESSGGDASQTIIAGNVYLDGPLITYSGFTRTGPGIAFQIGGSGVAVSATAIFDDYPPIDDTLFVVSLYNTSSNAFSAATLYLDSAGNIELMPGDGTTAFSTTGLWQIFGFTMTWAWTSPDAERGERIGSSLFRRRRTLESAASMTSVSGSACADDFEAIAVPIAAVPKTKSQPRRRPGADE